MKNDRRRVSLSGAKDLLRHHRAPLYGVRLIHRIPRTPTAHKFAAGNPGRGPPVRFTIIDCFTALAENSTPWSFLNASRPNRGRFNAPLNSRGVEGGVRGGLGETGFAPPGADKANSVSRSGQKIKSGSARRGFFGHRKPEV